MYYIYILYILHVYIYYIYIYIYIYSTINGYIFFFHYKDKPGITSTPAYVSKPHGGLMLTRQHILFSYQCYRLAI